MKLVRIQSIAALRQCAAAWDDLWWRSDSHLPCQRAELLAQWLEHFAPRQRFIALAIEDDGQLVATLPLVGQRRAKVLSVGVLATNFWTDAGDLLVDSQADLRRIGELLAQELCRLPWPLAMFDGVNLARPGWHALRAASQARHLPSAEKLKFQVGLIDITHDWDRYTTAWSGNHRRALRKLQRRAAETGDLQLEPHTELSPDQVAPLMQQALEIEDKSWKGDSGTSILRTPGMADFFLRQAQQLANWQQLELTFLKFDGRPIAFDYSYWAKGVVSSHKIGFDPEFRELGPGQLLRSLQLENHFADPRHQLMDTLGIMGEANAKWCTRSYELRRMLLSTGGIVGGAFIAAYQKLWPKIRRALKRPEAVYEPQKLGAADAIDAAGDAPGAIAEHAESR